MAAAGCNTQDMPPKGGYSSINYKRVPPKSYFGGWTIIGAYLGVATGAAYLYYLNCVAVHKREIEQRSSRNAIFPLLLAERDREYLKQLRRNRDEEAKLMANIPGWKVGEWFDEPRFRTLPKDTLGEELYAAYHIHADPKEAAVRADISKWS